MARPAPLSPGDTIGILGGGQLGRMLALAAARLGLNCHVFAPEAESPAFQVCAGQTLAAYSDLAALADFAGKVQAITYEFENVPVQSVRFLEGLRPVRPGAQALEVAQDRLREKDLARALGASTAHYAGIKDAHSLTAALQRIGTPAVLKTTRFGYDGKGQARITTLADAPAALAAMQGQEAILERFVAFDREVSVVAARGDDGAFAPFEVTQNEHRHHILHRSVVPAVISPAAAAEAIAITQRIADALDYVGVLAVEFFVLDAEGGQVIVNEIAPRVHNSGHWTQDGAITCQFEQHMRAVAGWPLGDPTSIGPAEMINLVGAAAAHWRAYLEDGRAHLHLYGKREIRAGRKMGHVNRLLG